MLSIPFSAAIHMELVYHVWDILLDNSIAIVCYKILCFRTCLLSDDIWWDWSNKSLKDEGPMSCLSVSPALQPTQVHIVWE